MTEQRPTAEEVRLALRRIVESPGFASAGRLPGFLSHLVERTLTGDSAALKESVLGSEVFQREASFDPRTDPVVRVEARRLRSRLEEYYSGPGREDSVRISLPKGGYVPVFSLSGDMSVTPSELPREREFLPIPKGRRLALLLTALAAAGITLGYCQSSYMRRVRQAPLASVAVLPFSNLGGDPDNEYFSDGLSEEIIDRLSRVPGLKVVTRSVISQYKGRNLSLQQIAQQVQASVIVEGSVRRSAGRLRVVARLANPNDGVSLWSQTYDRPLTGIFAVQDEIAQSIANALRVQVRGETTGRNTTQNIEAYNAFLKARYQANLYSKDGLTNSISYCEQALQLQPGYAPALAQLSINYALLGYYNALPASTWGPRSRQAAEEALKNDPSSADAYAAKGLVLAFHDWQWREAEAAFRQAIQLDDSSSLAHGLYAAAFLMPSGRFPEAHSEFRRALALDPVSSFINYTAAFALLSDNQLPAAVEQYRKTLELKNIHPDMYWDYGMALSMAGRAAEAREAMRKCYTLHGVPGGEPLALGAWYAGNPAKARADAPRSEALALQGRELYTDVARLYAVLGDKEKALHWLTLAVDRHENQALWLKADPRFRSLRDDPRHQALVRRVGLDSRP